jgi:hypothetical protein
MVIHKRITKKIVEDNTRRVLDALNMKPLPDGKFVMLNCGRCGGAGRLIQYRHIDGGLCFECNGARTYLESTEKFVRKYLTNERARLRNQEAVRKAAVYRQMMPAQQPWAAWSKFIGNIKKKALESNLSYYGAIGDKIETEVTVDHIQPIETNWGLSELIIMSDAEGHCFTWFTSSTPSAGIGDQVTLKGKIKDHKLYYSEFKKHDIKQTVMTRCKLVKKES